MSTEKLGDTGRQVATIHKADGAVIRVAISDYKGRRVVDVRVWYQPKDSIEFVPSRKGVTFDADKLPAMADAISQAMVLCGEWRVE